MSCHKAIPSVANTLKSITICNFLQTEFSPTYYNDKGDEFIYIFGKYINPYMKEIYHPIFIQEWRLKPETTAHLKNIDKKERLS